LLAQLVLMQICGETRRRPSVSRQAPGLARLKASHAVWLA
jgi:hypothetical protein